MFINGIEVLTTEELENTIIDMSEESKIYLRNMFNGVPNTYTPTQKEIDYQKYLKRAAAKDKIIAEMASENMERVRNGIWSVANLISLTQDTDLKHVLDDINTLSFELAMSKLQTITNPLLTAEIKLAWITKLQNNLYNG